MIKFFELLNKFLNQKCTHEKFPIHLDSGYCPDCGKLIKNEWYITRCTCCGKKNKAMIRHGEIVPQFHYCSNCGCHDFTVEKLTKIDFININYAVLKKTEIDEIIKCSTTTCWQEKNDEPQKLIGVYL